MLCFVLDEIFENNVIEFIKINPDGSEWFSNDQLALRNLTRLVKSTEVYSKAIFLGQSSPFKSIRDIETIGKDEVYAEIDLKSIVFPTTMPSQVKTNYFACFFFIFLLQGFIIIALDPLENIPDIDRFDNFFVQFIKFTDEEKNFNGPYVDLIPIGKRISYIYKL